MGLFDKKYCDICGEKIGLLGNRKLEDGNLCKNCAAKLSPWFTERRQSSLAEIKEQLAYREANKEAVAAFRTTRTLGRNMKVLLDENAGKFMVTNARDIEEANPDVLSFSDVTGCDLDVEEGKTEIHYRDNEGNLQSFNPRCYAYHYDFYMVIHVNHPYFDEIRFKLNSNQVDGDTETVVDCRRNGMGARPAGGSPMAGSRAGGAARPQGAGRPNPGARPAGGRPVPGGPGRPMGQRPAQNTGAGMVGNIIAGAMNGGMQPMIPVSNADIIRNSAEYIEYENMGWEIKDTLLQIREDARAYEAEANAPKQAVKCPYCGATTMPTANGCCEYCGAAL